MASTPTPLTAAQLSAIQQKFNLASVKSYPPPFTDYLTGLTSKSITAIFLVDKEPDGSTILANGTLPQSLRQLRANKFVAQGFAPIMLWALCWLGEDHFQYYKELQDAVIPWYPPYYLEGNGVLTPQAALGEPGQYALPGDFHPNMGLLGPYPTSKPEGWISVPDVNSLLVPGADVDALLAKMF